VRRFVSLLVQALSKRHVDAKYHAINQTARCRACWTEVAEKWQRFEDIVRTPIGNCTPIGYCTYCGGGGLLILLLYVSSCGVGSPNSNGVVELCISCRCSWYSYYAATCGVNPPQGCGTHARATEHVIRIILSENKAAFTRCSAGRSCFPKSCEHAQTALLHDGLNGIVHM
jgi:hypothetical protein